LDESAHEDSKKPIRQRSMACGHPCAGVRIKGLTSSCQLCPLLNQWVFFGRKKGAEAPKLSFTRQYSNEQGYYRVNQNVTPLTA